MQVFVSELLCGGGWAETARDSSLASEGRGMLLAVVADLAGLPDLEVVTTWHRSLGPFPFPGVRAIPVAGPEAEARVFDDLSASANWTLVIAPEFDHLLETRSRRVLANGGRLLGSSPDAIALAGDKQRTADVWLEQGLPTIPTRSVTGPLLANTDAPPLPVPFVIKPRFGAGSQATRVVSRPADWRALWAELADEPLLAQAVVQPLREGTPASCAVFCGTGGTDPIALPIARQHISTEGRLKYLGGSLSWPVADHPGVRTTVIAACRAIPGLRGYVGVDLLLRNGGAACELVELNPRLTTSYLGYRELAESGSCQPFAISDHEHPAEAARPDSLSTVPLTGGSRLAAALLQPNRALELNWRAGHFEYGAS
ncbi:MAG: ATP-grasp domain-containing protein [Planctomycetaceae bacterium]